MKAALISPFSMSGGGSTRLRDLVKNTDLEWIIILPQKDKYGVSPKDDPHLKFGMGGKSFLKLPVWILKTLRILHGFNPDVIHVLKPHPFTIIPAFFYKFLFGCRIVFDCDEWDPYTLSDNNAPGWEIMTSNFLTKIGVKYSDAILYANWMLLKDKIPEKLYDKCYYVPNGVDLEQFKPRSKEHKGFNIIFVGLLHKYKHVEPIIDAIKLMVKDVPDVKCIMVGGGEGLNFLKIKVRSLDLTKNFEFTGQVAHEKLPEILAEADVLVAPFRDLPGVRYQCNMKVFEYMGLQKPIVASAIGDLPEILGDTGYLVPPDDVKALVKAFKDVYYQPEVAGEKAERARKKVEKDYDWKVVSDNLLKAYCGEDM